MQFTVAVIKNREFPKIENENFLKQFLYEDVSKENRKRIKDEWTQFMISKIDHIEFVTVSTFEDMCGLITKEKSQVIETELSYPMRSDIYEVMYVMENYRSDTEAHDEIEINETNGMNYFASMCSLKHYPVQSKAVLLKTSYAGVRGNMNMQDILRIIRRRCYENVIVTDGIHHKKYSIQNMKYFCDLIFDKNEVVNDTVDVAGIKLDIYYRNHDDRCGRQHDLDINPIATRILRKEVRGKVIVRFKSLKSNMTMKQFLRFSVLSYNYKNPWVYGDSKIHRDSPIFDIDEYKLSQFIEGWKQIKNICQTCGETMTEFKHGILYNQRVCSDKCLI